MKDITLSLVLVINVCSITYAQDVLSEVFPKREQIWQKSYTADIIDFMIVDATEDIITLSSDKETFYLTYQDATGQEVWSISQSLGGGRGRRVGSLSVSDNGETIAVHGGSQIEEASQNWIFTKEGQLVFSELAGYGYYYPSPAGHYLSYEDAEGASSPFEIFHRDGTPVALDVPELLKVKRQNQRFIDENLVLVYREAVEEGKGVDELILIKIPEMNIKWRRKLNFQLWLAHFNQSNCAANEKYIAVQGSQYSSGGIVVVSRETGALVWESEELTSNYGLNFSPDGEILVALTQGKYLNLIDLKKQKVIESKQLFKNGLMARVTKFSWSGATVLAHNNHVSATDSKVFGGHVRGSYTAVLRLDEGFKVAKKNFIKGHLELRESKINQKPYLLSISGKSIVKNQINKSELGSMMREK